MRGSDSANIYLIRAVERIALVARYAAYLILAPPFFLGYFEGSYLDLGVITALVFGHNAYVHWIFSARRYDRFLTVSNFLIYLGEVSLATYITGADTSDAYLMYALVLIGFGAYHRRFARTLMAALACCAAYGVVLWIEFMRLGFETDPPNLVARFLFLFVSGWLVASMSEQLREGESRVRRQADALQASQATLRAILDNVAEPILVYDEREFIVDVNHRALEFLGLSQNELIGRRIRSFMFDDGTLPNKFAALRSRGEYDWEQILIRSDGDERTVDFHVRSYLREGQRFFVAVASDITEQKDLQEATRLANAHLEQLNRELRSVDQLRTAFLSTVSQKLRSPLTAVLGFIEMLLHEEAGGINTDQRTALQVCRRAVLRAFRIVDEALELRNREAANLGKGGREPAPSAESRASEAASIPAAPDRAESE